MRGNLHGIRVLDLTIEPGHFAGKLLGDLGADVVKIEPPTGDPVRHRGPFWGHADDAERSLQWLAYVNLGMLIFNLLPAFPLDGGRIARLLLGNVVPDARAVRLIAGTGLIMGAWSVLGIASYPALILAGPMLVLANYGIWKGELAAPAD